jgi:molybdenum cofactor cytidylyltransferase
MKQEVERSGGRALLPPKPPPEMRDSIQFGLQSVAEQLLVVGDSINLDRSWLLVPADHPVLEPQTVSTLLDAAAMHPGRIIVPTHAGRRGHPTVFAWRHALQIDQIPTGLGFNWILESEPGDIVAVEFASPSILVDLDTPEDYERLLETWK